MFYVTNFEFFLFFIAQNSYGLPNKIWFDSLQNVNEIDVHVKQLYSL